MIVKRATKLTKFERDKYPSTCGGSQEVLSYPHQPLLGANFTKTGQEISEIFYTIGYIV